VDTAENRLHLLYELNRRLTTLDDPKDFQSYITRRTREIFNAEGGSLLLLDRSKNEFYFPIASQSAASHVTPAQLAEIRFPADRGVAGWVLANDQAVWVPDVSKDSRFYSGIDEQTATETHSILAAPLRTSTGNIGVIELVNPADGNVDKEDLEFFEMLASDIAVSYEKAALLDRLRGEVSALRQLCRGLGVVLLGGGLLAAVGAVFFGCAGRTVERAAGGAGLWIGIVGAVIGVALIRAARRSDTGDESRLKPGARWKRAHPSASMSLPRAFQGAPGFSPVIHHRVPG
jgi:GAF domain-containing protein